MARQTPLQRWCSLVLLAVLSSLVLFYGLPGLFYRAGRAWESGRQSAAIDHAIESAIEIGALARHEQAELARHASERVRPAVVRVESRNRPTAVDENEGESGAASRWSCGLIIDREGRVATSFDAVAGAASIRVHIPDRDRTLAARLLASDPDTNLALLHLDVRPGDLPVAELSDGSLPGVGDQVFAIGNAFHPDPFVWVGTVDSGGRLVSAAGCCSEDFIQTPAANPWNLGGPLINHRGEVVGITTSCRHHDGDGRAIPAAIVREIIDELMAHGEVKRAWLGVFMHSVPRVPQRDFPPGAIALALDYVVPDGPADKAGLLPGDLILKVAGRTFTSSGEVHHLIAAMHDDESVTFSTLRGGVPHEPTVVVEDRPAAAPLLPGEAEWGVRFLSYLAPDERKCLGLKSTEGVVVQEGSAHGGAAELQPGDVILAVNGEPTKTLSDFCRVVRHWRETSPAKEAVLSICSRGVKKSIRVSPVASRRKSSPMP